MPHDKSPGTFRTSHFIVILNEVCEVKNPGKKLAKAKGSGILRWAQNDSITSCAELP
ncbi:MAG: hypothetical protein ACREQX_14610 [Candidatus Binataceae bacterium]